MLEYPAVKQKTAQAKKLIVFLHGFGSDGNDLISLSEFMQKENALEECYFIAPNGERCITIPSGRQWFSLVDYNYNRIIEELAISEKKICDIISKKQAEFGISNKDTSLVGFSQGGMFSLYLALTRTEDDPFACAISFSGKIIPPKHITNKKTPVLLVHGELDDVVSFSDMENTSQYFLKHNIMHEKLGIPNLAHSIDAQGIKRATEFIANFL